MDARTTNPLAAGLNPEAAEAFAKDPNALALLKAYLAIPDEAVRKKLRRLAEEIAAPAKRASSSNGSAT